MTDKKFIFETRVGSHLYGTSLPTSDDDFKGVFLPSAMDLLGMNACPGELSLGTKVSEGPRNSKGDVDRKFYSIQKFLKHAADGQPWAMEMLFAPNNMINQRTPEWDRVLQEAMPLILSRKGVAGFVGFALSQSYKATIKGENLNLIRHIIDHIATLDWKNKNLEVSDLIVRNWHPLENVRGTINDHKVSLEKAPDGTSMLVIAGRKFNFGLKVDRFLNCLEDMEARYGTRSNAAAAGGQDFKSLYHAYRLIFEAKEFLATGNISLPSPQAEFLLKVRQGQYEADYQDELVGHIDDLRQVIEPKSPLPLLPKWDKINEFCHDLLQAHLSAT